MKWRLPQRSFALAYALTAVVFTASVVLTAQVVDKHRSARIQLDLETEAAEFARRAAERMRESVEQLQVISLVFVAFEEVNAQQFKTIAQGYLEPTDSLLVLEWQPEVHDKDREDFERAARAQGIEGFTLWEPDAEDKPIPAVARAVHVPVLYMLSSLPGVDTTGLDLAWSPERMASKWTARDLGRAISSELFNVVTNHAPAYQPIGFAITLPIYRSGLVPDSVNQRRSELLGYLAGVYSLHRLLAPELQRLAEGRFNLQVNVGASTAPHFTQLSGATSPHSRRVSMELFGVDWVFSVSATREQLAGSWVWFLVPAGLALAGLLVLGVLRVIETQQLALESTRRELVEALAAVKRSESALQEISRHDPLTGLYNRRAFDALLRLEFERAARHGLSLGLLMIDLDRFKAINDQWGHQAGDQALRRCATICESSSRRSDICARFGGEEFVLLMPHADEQQAIATAERLRQAIAAAPLALDAERNPVHMTASVGVAVVAEPVTIEELIRRADVALYTAKRDGRNCVRVFEAASAMQG